jgi:phytoene dehydrogenase-like protein
MLYETSQRVDAAKAMGRLGFRFGRLGAELTTFAEFMAAPATKILDKWFESDVLKATLATDAIIGAKVRTTCPEYFPLDRRPTYEYLRCEGFSFDSWIGLHTLPPRHGGS